MSNEPRAVGEEDPGFPAYVIALGGDIVDTSTEVWTLRGALRGYTINWTRLVGCPADAVYAAKLHLWRLIESRSTSHAYNSAKLIFDYLCVARDEAKLDDGITLASLTWYLERHRKKRTAFRFNLLRRWYLDSTDRLLPGFDDEIAFALSEVRIGRQARGVAVLSADPEEGPLSSFEEAALRRALMRDEGHIQQRAALWLFLAYGSNPANISFLREEDVVIVDCGNNAPSACFLNMPRIKKRMLPRADFKRRYVNQRLADIIRELIDYNRTKSPSTAGPRPLFHRHSPELGKQRLPDYVDHLIPERLGELVDACVRRLGVISPRTNKPLKVTPRRLRYTFACKMVRDGISPAELAELLDHSDTQSVDVYYRLDSRFVERLDKTIAVEMGPLVRAFMGVVIQRPNSSLGLIPFRDMPELGGCRSCPRAWCMTPAAP